VKKLLSEKERFLIADAIGRASHEQLWHITKKVPSDFQPWGKRDREGPDCSCGCKFYFRLSGNVGGDWGVCWNPKSPRAGLVTFEHQGCPQFSYDIRWDKL